MRRAVIISMLGLGLACLMAATGALADQEPNDDFAGAEEMPGSTVAGSVDPDTDEADYYWLKLSEGQYITVTFRASTGQDFLYGTLADWEQYTVFELKSKGDVEDSSTYHTSNETAEATWYFYVASDTEAGSYEFTFTLTDQDDGGMGKDAGGDMEFADPINPVATVDGLLADADEEDWYRFYAGEGDIIDVTLTSESDADFIYLDLVDWEDWTIFTIKSKGSVVDQGSWFTALETTGTHWYLRVHMDTDMGNYQLALDVDHQDDAGSGTEAPGDTASAMELAPGSYRGHLEDEDEDDCYRFRMGEGARVHVTFSSSSAGDFLYVELVDWEGWSLWTMPSKASVEDEGWYWTANETPEAWYYLVVGMDTEPGDYDLSLDVEGQDDAGSGGDVAGTDAQGLVLQAGTYTGWLGDADEADAYRVEVQEGWTVWVNLTVQGAEPAEAAIIGDPGAAPVETITSKEGTAGTWTGIIEVDHAADGHLYVVVAPVDTSAWEPGDYALQVDVVTTPADTEPPQVVMEEEPGKAEEGKAKTITVTVTDNEAIENVTLYYRIDDEVVWSEVAMTSEGDTWSGSIPGHATMDALEVEYVVIAWDAAGNNQTYGDFRSPKSMEVTKPEEDDGPGFGAVMALASLAVLAAGLARWRRPRGRGSSDP